MLFIVGIQASGISIPVLSRVSFVPPEVDARANLVHYPCVHLVKTAADVHMISGSTVSLLMLLG